MAAEGGDRDALSRWVREHAVHLDGLEPESGQHDLEPLGDLVGDARVVAIGENSHFIREFALLRHRMLRFLVERCGFTVCAFESGFSEGFAMDAWVQGTGSADDLNQLAESAIPSGMARPQEVRESLRWMRRHNESSTPPARFVGVDVPQAAGSLLPALEPLTDYLQTVDPDALSLVDEALVIAKRASGTTMAQSAPRYLELDRDQQDTLTAVLSRLVDRFDALAPRYVAASDSDSHDIARWRLEAARSADHHLRAVAGAFAGTALPGAATARERYMAASVRWWLDHVEPGTRMVLLAHNTHIQRTPVIYDGQFQVLPMGLHLDRMLGSDYVSVGVTSGTGQTAALHPAADQGPYGFIVEPTELAPPEDSSIEAMLAAADVGLGLVDLRAARHAADRPEGEEGLPDRIRMDSDYIHTPVLDAFDAMAHVPRSSLAPPT